MMASRYFSEGHIALVASMLLALAAGGCAALPGLTAALGLAAPVVVSAIDAYTATARALSGPSASTADVAAVAVALAERDRCTLVASSALMPAADAGPTDQQLVLAAVRDGIAATQALEQAIAHAAPLPSSVLPSTDAGAPAPIAAGAH